MVDVVVIGAGPAGLGAASVAAGEGASVVLIDGAVRSGGQYWRHGPAGPDSGTPRRRVLERLRSRLDRVKVLMTHRVWQVSSGGDGFVVRALAGDRDERPVVVRGATVVVATGAHDRVVPFPGWDLPGVMTAGGAQAMLKAGGAVLGSPVAVSGTGPLLVPVAGALAAAGADVTGVYEANRVSREAMMLVSDPARLAAAGGFAAVLSRHRVGYHPGRVVVAARGDGRVEEVTVARVNRDWTIVSGTDRVVPCTGVAVGFGLSPQLDVARQLGCRIDTDEHGDPFVVVSATQRTSVPGVYAAGEVTGVGGAALSLVEGRLAGYAVTGARPPGRLLARRAGLRRFAARMSATFSVRTGWRSWLDDDTIVCRCEEVTAGAVASAVRAGGFDTRTVKLLSRAGMGYCQGRMCGAAVTALLGGSGEGNASLRRIAQPIRMADLAADEPDDGSTG